MFEGGWMAIEMHRTVCFIVFLFMALSIFLPTSSSTEQKHRNPPAKRSKRHQKPRKKPPSSWDQIKNLLTCKQIEGAQVHDPANSKSQAGYSKLGSSCHSICTFRDVALGSTRDVHRRETSTDSGSLGPDAGLLGRTPAAGNGSFRRPRGMPLGKLSGCYECRMIVDPSRYPTPRTTICACSECGEVFTSSENLEAHRAVRHAVSELGPDDSGRNIVEIIFKSSWLKREGPAYKIERILKVHNSQRTITRFEDHRATVKARSASATVTGNKPATAKKNPRCAADGNELLRFHCTTLTCALGARGSTSLCGPGPGCGVCGVIHHGFTTKGVRTTASSGRAHDSILQGLGESRRAMLVCRVIAGRVRRGAAEVEEWYDSAVAGSAGAYTDLEELMVFNPRAILPCFVVIYKMVD